MSEGPAAERPDDLAGRRRLGAAAMARIRELRRGPLPMLDAVRLIRKVREELEELDEAAGDAEPSP